MANVAQLVRVLLVVRCRVDPIVRPIFIYFFNIYILYCFLFKLHKSKIAIGPVVELVDTLDLGSSAERCEGSSPFRLPFLHWSLFMSLKEIKSKKLYKEYSLVIPFDEIDKEINQKIKSIIPTISLPGFKKESSTSIVKNTKTLF